VVRGDSIYLCIAAASIIAKVWRDRLITELAQEYPQYDLENNKGYATAKHREAIFKLGLTNLHRSSFCSHLVNSHLVNQVAN
jgi:ribonuclease HII